MLKNILKNSILTALIRGASFGVRIFALLIAARYSEPAYFATIALFFTVAEIGRLLADFGIDTYTMREYASHRNKAVLRQTIGAAMSAKLVLGLLVAIASTVVMLHLRPGELGSTLPFALMVMSPLLMNLPINFFIAKMRGRHIAPFVAMAGLLSLGVFYGLFTFASNPALAFFSIPAAEALVGLFLIAKVPVMRGSLSCLNFPGMLKLLKMTLPIAAATILGITYGRMDVFFLEKFRSAEELGLYAFAVRLVEPFQFIAGALAVNAYGHIAKSLKTSVAAASAVNARYRKVMALYAGLALLAVLLLANVLLLYTFKQYAAAQAMLNVIGCILIFKCGNLISTAAIQAHGKYKFITSVAVWNFTFLSVAMLLLVPRFGAYGALFSILAMESLNFLIQNILLRKLQKSNNRDD